MKWTDVKQIRDSIYCVVSKKWVGAIVHYTVKNYFAFRIADFDNKKINSEKSWIPFVARSHILVINHFLSSLYILNKILQAHNNITFTKAMNSRQIFTCHKELLI